MEVSEKGERGEEDEWGRDVRKREGRREEGWVGEGGRDAVREE